MSQLEHWRPPIPDPEVMEFIDGLCERFRGFLNEATSLEVQDWADQIKQYVAEIKSLYPDDTEAWECGLYWLIAELVEHQINAGSDVTLSAEAYRPYFPDHMHVVRAAHRQVSVELPQQIGRYEILDRIAEGGFGVVYLAYADHLRRNVALKTFPSGASREAISKEVQHAIELRHESIVPVYDLAYDAEYGWHIAMQFVHGRSMDKNFQNVRPTPTEAVELMLQIAEAVYYAHTKGIIHRDLKPANILIDDEGRPHVTDFGLAIHKFNQPDHIGELAGTYAYMAPEQLRREPVDEKTDAWALGVIFYELLVGDRPFVGDNEDELKNAILNKSPESFPADMNNDIPAHLRQLCIQALQKLPPRRLSVKELCSNLRSIIRRPEDVLRRERGRWFSRPVKFVAGVACICAVLGLVWYMQYAPARTNQRPAGELRVESFEVRHYRGVPPRLLGTIGTLSYAAQEDDNVRIHVRLSAPAYCYLVALNPNGTVIICPKSRDGQRPSATREIVYPADDRRLYGLTDGIGLQGFVLIASRNPLPAFDSWPHRKTLAWATTKDVKGVWLFDGRRFDLLDSQDRSEREVASLTPASLSTVCNTLRELPFIDVVQAVAFPVESPSSVSISAAPAQETKVPAVLSVGEARKVEELATTIVELRNALKDEEALPLAHEILEIRIREQGLNHWETADARALVKLLMRTSVLSQKQREELVATYHQIDEAKQHFGGEQFADCLGLLEQALEVRQRLLGADARETVACKNNLAMVLSSLGKFQEAQVYYEQAADGLRRTLGEHHPEVATAYSNLGLNLQELHRLDEALTTHMNSLTIALGSVGPEARETAVVQNNVGMVLDELARHEEAREYYQKALPIFLRDVGEENLHTIRCRNNLAANAVKLALYTEAEHEFRTILEICKTLFPPENTEIATVAINLASVLDDQGKYVEAEGLLRDALGILERSFSSSHPYTADCLSNLAANLSSQGRLAEAEPLQRMALSAMISQYGERNDRVARFYNNLAATLVDQGYDAEAERLYCKSIEIWTKIAGEHAETANVLNNFGMFLATQGRFDEAEPLLLQSLAMRRKFFGPTHPITAQSLNNLGGINELRRQHKKAERYYRSAYEIRVARNPIGLATAESCNNLAAAILDRDRFDERERLCRESLAIRQRHLSQDHPLVGQSYNNLGNVLFECGEYAEAEQIWTTAASIFETSRLHMGNTGMDRVQYAVERSPLLRLAAVLAMRGKSGEAWQRLEEHLGRGLLDDLSARQLKPLTADERLRESDLLGQLQALDEQISRVIANTDGTRGNDERLDVLRQKQNSLHGEIVTLQNEFALKYGEFTEQPGTLAEVQSALSGESALICWVDLVLKEPPNGEHSACHWACVIRSKGDPLWVRTPGLGADRNRRSDDDNRRAKSIREGLHAQELHWSGMAAELARQRLEPLWPQLIGVKHLIVLPSFALSGVPVEVLIEAQQDPAAPRPTVSYAPSGTLLAQLSKPRKSNAGELRLLAAGDPRFTTSKPAAVLPPPEYGIAVVAVLPNGSADRAGLRPNDVLLKYNGTTLRSDTDLKVPAEATAETITLEYWRDGEIRSTVCQGGKLGIQIATERTAADVMVAKRSAEEILRSPSRGETLSRLPWSGHEVKAIAGLFPTNNVTVLLGEHATESAIQRLAQHGDLKTYRLLHLATHGKANPKVAMNSAICFTPDRDRSGDPLSLNTDGQITAQQIMNTWDLDADLVVLSACETGLGRYAGGEGYLGFTQALFAKGARSVVLSLWKVDDQATSLLMRRFYENLLGKRYDLAKALPKAEALAEAKAWLRHLDVTQAEEALAATGLTRGERIVMPASDSKGTRPFEHPFFWAAFVLVGDPN